MDQERLREQLAQLHGELENVNTVDDNTRRALADLRNDIQDLLDRPGNEVDHRYGTLNSRLRADVGQFEATHPRLTALMERAIDALVQMGV